MRWEEVHVKWCWMENLDFGAKIVVEESMNLQALHWPTPHGKGPQSGGDFLPGVGCCALGYLKCFCCVEKRLGGIGENG